jgi:hypothetical protein
VDFYLGTHMPGWLASAGVPLFVSYGRLRGYKRLPRAAAPWALDSWGFSVLSRLGYWPVSARDYAADVRRYADEIGGLAWAATQDYMCEPQVLAKTGLSVAEHQARTIASYVDLRDIAPEITWVPVLQGWVLGDYVRHVDAYARAGVDLASVPLVGLGSVCRRQHTAGVEMLIRQFARDGIRLHGFGFKVKGLARVADRLASADSLAWSFRARRNPPSMGARTRAARTVCASRSRGASRCSARSLGVQHARSRRRLSWTWSRDQFHRSMPCRLTVGV